MFGNRGAAQPGGGSKNCTEDAKKWWANCPFGYKFIFTAYTTLYLASWLTSIFAYLMMQVPVLTVTKFRFWTVATTFLLPRDLFDWLIGIYLIYQDGKRIENKIGTAHFLTELVFKNSCIQIGFIIFMYLLQFIIGGSFTSRPSVGLFPIFIHLLALRGLAEPEQERPFMCFPVMVKNKWYVWILYGLIALISGSLVPDLLMAIGLAYLEVYVFNGKLLDISQLRLQKIENSCLFKKARGRADFITLDNAGGDGIDVQLPVQQQQQQEQQQAQQSAFSGRGVSIGVGSAAPQSVLSHQPPQNVVINPSQNPQQAELRRAAAQAAMNRMEQESTGLENVDSDQNQQQQNSNVNQDQQQQKQKDGYGQLNEEKEEDLI